MPVSYFDYITYLNYIPHLVGNLFVKYEFVSFRWSNCTGVENKLKIKRGEAIPRVTLYRYDTHRVAAHPG